MEISINSLISIEKAVNDTKTMFKTVDSVRKVVILKDNKPAYILLKYEENIELPIIATDVKFTYKLHEAMKIVLSEAENQILHASELADVIYKRKLYVQKNGGKAKANQIRARCSHYPEMFEALPGNYIRLKHS